MIRHQAGIEKLLGQHIQAVKLFLFCCESSAIQMQSPITTDNMHILH